MLYDILMMFFAYAFLGWCVEASYAALKTGQFVNRGFLNGPICPIYGFGVILVLTCLHPLRGSGVALFLGSVLLTSLLELITGFLLEKIFQQRWWDYSEEPFNLGGYICLRFSIGWGLACLFVIKLIHPTVTFTLHAIPHPIGQGILCLFFIGIAIDIAATIRAISKLNYRLNQIDEAAAKIRELSDELGENIADKVIDAAERGSDLKEVLENQKEELRSAMTERKSRLQQILDMDQASDQRRLLKAFPKMHSSRHPKALEHLRHRAEHNQKKRKS